MMYVCMYVCMYVMYVMYACMYVMYKFVIMHVCSDHVHVFTSVFCMYSPRILIIRGLAVPRVTCGVRVGHAESSMHARGFNDEMIDR